MFKKLLITMFLITTYLNANQYQKNFIITDATSKYYKKINKKQDSNNKQTKKIEKGSTDKNTNITIFNPSENDYDYGCVNYEAGLENKYTKKLLALYYSVYHELWKNNKKLQKYQEPTILSSKVGIKTMCKKAFSKNKSVEFLIYKRALRYKMTSERFLDISGYINSHIK